MIRNLPQLFREPYCIFPSFPGVPKHKFLIMSCSKCNPHPPSKHATIAMRHDKLVLPNRTFQAEGCGTQVFTHHLGMAYMIYIWFLYGLYMVYIWCIYIYGLYMVYMVYMWFIHGLYMVYTCSYHP